MYFLLEKELDFHRKMPWGMQCVPLTLELLFGAPRVPSSHPWQTANRWADRSPQKIKGEKTCKGANSPRGVIRIKSCCRWWRHTTNYTILRISAVLFFPDFESRFHVDFFHQEFPLLISERKPNWTNAFNREMETMPICEVLISMLGFGGTFIYITMPFRGIYVYINE